MLKTSFPIILIQSWELKKLTCLDQPIKVDCAFSGRMRQWLVGWLKNNQFSHLSFLTILNQSNDFEVMLLVKYKEGFILLRLFSIFLVGKIILLSCRIKLIDNEFPNTISKK
jgi:hypothetical protein